MGFKDQLDRQPDVPADVRARTVEDFAEMCRLKPEQLAGEACVCCGEMLTAGGVRVTTVLWSCICCAGHTP